MNRMVKATRRKRFVEAMCATAVLAFSAPGAVAQTATWGGGSGDWNSANWTWSPTGSGYPSGPTIDVVIEGTTGNLSTVTLDNVTVSVQDLSVDSYSTLTVQGQNLYVAGTSVTNSGLINVGVSGNSASLYLDESNVTLSGGGTVNLGDPNSYVRGYAGSENLVNSDNTIQGQGYIYSLASFTNNATVNANVSGGTLQIYGVATTNTGTLEATGGGTLHIYGTTVTNTGGTISTDGSSSVLIESSTIDGGNLSSTGGGVIHAISGTTLNDVTITTGTIYSIDGGNSTYLTSDLVNQGTIQVGRDGSASNLYLYETNANLTGGGTINLNDPNSYIRGYAGSENLTNTDNLIQGQGYIYGLASFTNKGTVDANVSGGTLYIYGVNTTNSGILEATNGGRLYIYGSTINDAGSTISTDSSSSLVLDSATINGGNLTSSGGVAIHAIDSTTLNDVTITTGTIYSIDGGNSTYLTSDLVNQGTIQVGRDGSASNLYLYETNANLTGGGTINLNDPNSYIRGYAGSENLTNTDNLIQGQGYIYGLASFTNKGTVDANVSGGTLYIYDVNTTNSGTLEATNGGRLYIYGSTINDAGSTISTDSSSSLVLDSATINGGNLTSSGGVAIHAIDSTTLNDVTITTGTIYSIDGGNNGYLTSDLVNQGTIQVGRDGSASNLYLYETNVNLTGGGTINLNDSNSYFRGYAGSENLTNTDNVIQGQGYIYNLASFVNHGTVSANVEGGTLNIYGATTTTNSGTFQVSQGSTLAISYGSFTNSGTVNIGSSSDTSGSLFQMVGSNDYVQTAGTTTLGSAYSTLAVQSGQSVNIEGGLLQGFGTIQGNLINSGTVHPGDGPGTLTVTGNYTQNSGGVLDIAIGGLTPGSQYGVLSVTGSASLDGTLDISLLNGFTPTSGDTFVILTSSDLNGMFTDSTIQIGNVTFDVEYSPAGYANDVVLAAETSAVPEPASLVMLTVGLAGAGVVIARRRQVSQT